MRRTGAGGGGAGHFRVASYLLRDEELPAEPTHYKGRHSRDSLPGTV